MYGYLSNHVRDPLTQMNKRFIDFHLNVRHRSLCSLLWVKLFLIKNFAPGSLQNYIGLSNEAIELLILALKVHHFLF
jgi:hypothetical protein